MIDGYSVELNTSDVKRILRALTKVESSVKIYVDQLPYTGAVKFAHTLRQNIESQKFASTYAPYSERYRKWKGVAKGKTDFWVLYGDLLRNIVVMQSSGLHHFRKGWFAGIPPGIMDRGGKSWLHPKGSGNPGKSKEIAKYFYWGEYGRRGQPARPVITPTAKEFIKEWRTMCRTALRNVQRVWK